MFISAFSWIRWDSISGSYLIWIVCDCEVLSVSYCYSVIVILSQLLLFIVQLAQRRFVGRCNGLALWALKLSHWRGTIGSADWRVAHPWCNTWTTFYWYDLIKKNLALKIHTSGEMHWPYILWKYFINEFTFNECWNKINKLPFYWSWFSFEPILFIYTWVYIYALSSFCFV